MNNLLVSAEIQETCVKARDLSRTILNERYDQSVMVFSSAITNVQSRRQCSLADATGFISNELNRTGHTTLLLYAALADLLDGQGSVL